MRLLRWHSCVTWPIAAAMLTVAASAAAQAIDPSIVATQPDLASDLIRGTPTSLALALAAWLAARATSTGIPVHHTIKLDSETIAAIRGKT